MGSRIRHEGPRGGDNDFQQDWSILSFVFYVKERHKKERAFIVQDTGSDALTLKEDKEGDTIVVDPECTQRQHCFAGEEERTAPLLGRWEMRGKDRRGHRMMGDQASDGDGARMGKTGAGNDGPADGEIAEKRGEIRGEGGGRAGGWIEGGEAEAEARQRGERATAVPRRQTRY